MTAFDNSEFHKYKQEAQERWGHTEAYKEHEEKTKGYSGNQWNSLAGTLDAIMEAFALCKKGGNSPESEDAQALVAKLQGHITENYYTCTPAILAGLGQMYVADGRFKANIDRHGEGTAEFIAKAIESYAK